MKIFNKLFPSEREIIPSENRTDTITIEKENQLTLAYTDSKSCEGRIQNLKSSLEALYEKYFTHVKNDGYEQDKLKQPYQTEQETLKEKITQKDEAIHATQKKIENTQLELQELHQKGISTIDKSMIWEETNSQSNIKLWIGMFFLIPLSFYIFIFYISTSYSAFFKVFDPQISLFNSVFEANALSKAMDDGPLEAGFVFLIPFVFFSLGYLIHMFWSQKRTLSYIKVIGLLVLTFSFDAILAYLIDKKEYDFNKTPLSPEFTIMHAIQDPTFWLIIFAGFVSYLVWGLVFDMVMIENSKRDILQFFRKNLKEKIKQKKKEVAAIKIQLEDHEKEKSEFDIRVKELQAIIEGFILPIQNYKMFSSSYLKGWQKYIAAELPLGQDEKTKLLLDCQTTYQAHIKGLDLESDDYQNKVFTKTL
ncbi:hypothetical protein [Aquimarina pacifica]|uniref:hypothetical protein n=1 Tax=Aquimarina pacifica TaxID=1296415 RepID=UPI0004700079|nr:hypothetical protein [Aquimarina pacifica]